MSEFNIKQQNRNRFKASKEKKQAARFKQSEKLGRNQYVERQSNASESSESVEMPVEKKRTPRSEKRKNREKKKNDDSNQKERVDRSVANRELDNPSPCSSKSPKWSNQNTKENNPFIFQSSQKGKPWKVAVNSEQSNNSPRQFEKVKYEKNETKSSTYVPVSPVAKLQRTNFQWFNPSAVQADSDDGIIANESSKKHCTKKTNESSKNHSTKKSNESLNNKPQRNINSQKGQNTQKSVPFTTAGLSQNEMKTVRGLFSEPSTSKSIDSDLSDKYDCSRGSKNNVSDFRSQQPTSNDKSREESSIDQSGNSKKYRKRAIKSHANRNYDLPSYEENEDDLEGEGFDDLSKATFSVSSHFLMKEQKEWLEQSESCINPFAWNLKCLAAALHTIPFHQRQSLPENLFTSNEITHLTSEADSKLQNYEDVRREAEEGGKTEVCREADDDILKDDFISDFLTCRDSFSTDKSNGGAENDGGFVISNARTSYLLNLDLDQDDFESQFSTHTIVSQNEDDLKKAKKKNRKSKNKSNQNKTVAGKSVEVEHSGKLLRSDSDLSNLLRSSSEEEAVKHNEQKSKLKNNTSSSPAKITRFGKTRKEILVGDKSNTTQNAKEKQQNVDSTCSSVLADRVVEGNVSSSEDALCPSQSTEKRTRIRGSSAFNITESLSDLIAGKSSLTSEPISSPNMESFKTSAKSSSVPNSKEDSLATSFKRLNFGSPTNYKFDFKMSSPTLHSKASNPFELKTFSPSPSKKTNNFHDSTSNTSNTFKTQIFTPSPPKKSSVETKRASSKPSKLVCKFDYRIREEDTEENSSSIPSLVVTPSKKATPAIDIAKKSSASNALSRSAGGASSLASASPSSSGSKPVIDDDDDDDDEIDSLLGITSHTPNDKTGSRCASDEHLPIANKEKQQAASDSKQPSTSMLDENLDDWLDSVLQS